MPSSLSSLKNAARHMFGMPGEKAQAPAQAKPGKSHSLTGFLGGLTSRARPGGNKVHPEPMSMPPRAAMPRPPGRPGSPVHQAAPAAQTAQQTAPPAMASQPYAPRVPPWRDVSTQTASRPTSSPRPQPAVRPAPQMSAAERAGNAELDAARAVVAEGRPDLHKMYTEAMERVDRNNRINQNSTLLEPEDRVMEHVDFAAIDKDYDRKLARFEKASKIVDAAANPAQARAQAAAFQAEVRAEARSMAERAYHADVREARDIVRQGPVSYDQVEGWARADARQNYTTVGSERLDYDAIVRDYDRIKERFEAAEQLLSRPLTGEETAARMDAQMAEAERRVRQRQDGAGTRR